MKEAKRKIRSAVLVVFLVLTAFSVPAMTNNVSAELEPTPIDSALVPKNTNESYVPGEVIVGFQDSIPEDVEMIIAQYGGEVRKVNHKINFVVVANVSDVDTFITCVTKEPLIKYAEVNKFCHITQFPNDPLFLNKYYSFPWSNQWAPQQMNVPGAWDICTGSYSVTVAIVDSGIDFNHPELRNNIWFNVDEIPSNEIDDDGNGYIDDYLGAIIYNYVPGSDMPGTPYVLNTPIDEHGHGTFCAGVVAAQIDNSIGISGIAQVNLMAVRWLDANGEGIASDCAEAILYATDNGANVISMSIAEGGQAVSDACAYSWNHGAVIVSSSGNDNIRTIQEPASYNSVIAVGASNHNDQRCNYDDWADTTMTKGSSFGPEIELMAPGQDIVSSLSGVGSGPLDNSWFYAYGARYAVWNGTSMATPHVAGVAALVMSANPYLTNQQVRNILQITADDLAYTRGNEIAGIGWDEYTGYGRVNALAAVEYATETMAPLITSFSINSGNQFTNTREVSTSNTASDIGLGLNKMRFSNSNSLSWQLPKFRAIETPHGHPLRQESYNYESPYFHELEGYAPNKNYYHYINGNHQTRIHFDYIELATPGDILSISDSRMPSSLAAQYEGPCNLQNVWVPAPATGFYFHGDITVRLQTDSEGTARGYGIDMLETYLGYPNNRDNTWEIKEPGATQMKVHFEKIELSTGDYVYLYDGNDDLKYSYTGNHPAFWSPAIPGDTIKVRFVSNSDFYTAWGFKIDQYQYYGAPWGAWQPYSTTANWQLSSGDGLKTVYCQVMDYAGNLAQASDTITLDTTGPAAPAVASSTHPDTNAWYPSNTVTVGWTPPNGMSPMVGYSIYLDKIPSTIPDAIIDPVGTTKKYTDVADGIWYFHVRAQDGAGNWGETAHYGPIKIDTPPVIRLQPRETWVGGTAEKDYVNSDVADVTRFIVRWDAAIEPLGVSAYELQEWSSLTGTYATIYTDSQLTYTISKQSIPDGTYFYYRVRARSSTTNGGGFLGPYTGSSDGITVDKIPPSPITGVTAQIANKYSVIPNGVGVKYGDIGSSWDWMYEESDDTYWTISERSINAKQQIAEAIFEMPITTGSGTGLTVGVEAFISTYYNDNFAVYYSRYPSGPYAWLGEITKRVDDNRPNEFVLPTGTYYGALYIKIKDTIINENSFNYDTLSIDTIHLKWNSDLIDTTTLNVDWTPSTSPDVEYYEIYRSSTPNGFDFGADSPIATLPVTMTSWLEHGGLYDQPQYILGSISRENDYLVEIASISPPRLTATPGGICYFDFFISNKGLADSYALSIPIFPSGISYFVSSPVSIDAGYCKQVSVKFVVGNTVQVGSYKLAVEAISNTDNTQPIARDRIDFYIDVVPEIEPITNQFYSIVAVDNAGNKGICLDLIAGKITAEPAGQYSIELDDACWNFISTPFVSSVTKPEQVLHTIRATDIPSIEIGHLANFPTTWDLKWSSTSTQYIATIPTNTPVVTDSIFKVGPIDLSNLGPNVNSILFEFGHSFDIRGFNDGAVVEGSLDGTNFFKLIPSGGFGYTDVIEEGSTALVGSSVYTGSGGGNDRFDLTQFTNQKSFYLRFRMCAEPYPFWAETWRIYKESTRIVYYKWIEATPFAFRYDAALVDHTMWPTISPIPLPPRPHPDPGPHTQLMTSIDNTMGVHLRILEADQSLITTGTIPISTTIHLYPGLNEVGYPSFLEKTVSEALAGIQYTMIYTYESGNIRKLTPTDIMRPGVGYAIMMPNHADWTISGFGRIAGLNVGEVSVSSENTNEGEEVLLSTIITNNDGSPAYNVTVNFYVSSEPTLIKSIIIPLIESEESVEVSAIWIAEPGNHEFRVTADYNGIVTDGYVSEALAFTYVNPVLKAKIYASQEIEISLAIDGKPGNTALLSVIEDGNVITSVEVLREVDDEPTTGSILFEKHLGRTYELVLTYDATYKGANPTWVTISSNEFSKIFFISINTKDGLIQNWTLDSSYLDEVSLYIPYYHFDGTSSYDPNGIIISYDWDFGDGAIAQGPDVCHYYIGPGTYTVTLTVSNDEGIIATESILVEIR